MISSDYNKRKHLFRIAIGAIIALLLFGTAAGAPNITSWGNNYTNDKTLLFNVAINTPLNFNVTANQTVTYNWTVNNTDQNQNYDNFSIYFTAVGTTYINATINNTNGTDSKNWTVNVQPKTIDVTLSNVPINFGSLSSGSLNLPSLSPLNVTIQNTTNVNFNLTINGTNFMSGIYSFGVENLNYSNSSTGTNFSMNTSFPLPPFADWVNIQKQVNTNRSIYFWINVPVGQRAGAYSSTITVREEEYI